MEAAGKVHIYYGDGKGKSTAAFGLALRVLGYGERVVVGQFLKAAATGEVNFCQSLAHIEIFSGMPSSKFTYQMTPEELQETANACNQRFTQVTDSARDAKLLILDEVIDACTLGLLDVRKLIAFLKTREAQLEAVLTGHSLPLELADQADYITWVKKEKHPYDQGLGARKGIEF